MVFEHKPFLEQLTKRPGIYKMFDAKGKIIYVGKAKNLHSRLSSYFRNSTRAVKTQALLEHLHDIEVSITRTEAEALILECNLIKKHRPKYNILLKDDKSYPLLRLSRCAYPGISYYRGSSNKKDADYFGPYPNSYAVRENLKLLQKLFKIRPCSDSVFNNRSRPCLQHQIKRCSAPCVGLISKAAYKSDIANAKLFLKGKSPQIIDNLIAKMDSAAKALDYEQAAIVRDQIKDIQAINQQHLSFSSHDLDVIAVAYAGNKYCVELHSLRQGQNLGSRAYFPQVPTASCADEVLSSFIALHYTKIKAPKEIVIDRKIDNLNLLQQALSMHANMRIKINANPIGERAAWLDSTILNAQNSLQNWLNRKSSFKLRFTSLQQLLDLPHMPNRLECFDISHTQGAQTVASCVVFDHSGMRKDLYRKFNIDNIQPGDDYAAMEQAIRRRLQRLQGEQKSMPDILVVDGGKGQAEKAQRVIDALNLPQILLLAIVKGAKRQAESDRILIPRQQRSLEFDPQQNGIYLIQELRNEAHRFALLGHRTRRAKTSSKSTLEQIPGIGAKKRQQLLKHFGGIQGIMQAGVAELCKVPGISHKLAANIYEHLNNL